MKVTLTYLVDEEDRFDGRKIQKWIKMVVESEGKKLGIIEIVFTSNKHLLKINQQFLKHTYFTDVIAFGNCRKNIVNGDIIISFDQVKINARKFKVTFDKELLRVMVHGVLHLVGYLDDSAKEKEIMRRKEDQYLNLANSII